jgi:hypothetical protein
MKLIFKIIQFTERFEVVTPDKLDIGDVISCGQWQWYGKLTQIDCRNRPYQLSIELNSPFFIGNKIQSMIIYSAFRNERITRFPAKSTPISSVSIWDKNGYKVGEFQLQGWPDEWRRIFGSLDNTLLAEGLDEVKLFLSLMKRNKYLIKGTNKRQIAADTFVKQISKYVIDKKKDGFTYKLVLKTEDGKVEISLRAYDQKDRVEDILLKAYIPFKNKI